MLTKPVPSSNPDNVPAQVSGHNLSCPFFDSTDHDDIVGTNIDADDDVCYNDNVGNVVSFPKRSLSRPKMFQISPLTRSHVVTSLRSYVVSSLTSRRSRR